LEAVVNIVVGNRNLSRGLPLSYHFQYWARQSCHILAYRDTASFVREFTHCSTKTVDQTNYSRNDL